MLWKGPLIFFVTNGLLLFVWTSALAIEKAKPQPVVIKMNDNLYFDLSDPRIMVIIVLLQFIIWLFGQMYIWFQKKSDNTSVETKEFRIKVMDNLELLNRVLHGLQTKVDYIEKHSITHKDIREIIDSEMDR